MRNIAIVLLLGCLTASAGGHSQGITLSKKKASLESVFRDIEKQTDYSFFYRINLVPGEQKVTIEIKNGSIREVLDKVLKDFPLAYEIINKTIVIKEGRLAQNLSLPAEPTVAAPAPIDVSGRLINENGEPVAGASVKVKGTNNGTTTDDNGNFSLKGVRPDDVLVFSGTNFEMFETKLSGRTSLDLTAKIKRSPLDEVQIIAYGEKSKRAQVGNVGSVKGEDLAKQPVTNPLLALQGRVPGLFITQESGVPGAPVTVRIQGQNSIRNGNDPLVVIDGVPYYFQMPITGNQAALYSSSKSPNALNFIDVSEIESVEVLKDADATAIYGSRAANGAILITTKKGRTGKPVANITIQQGWGKVTRKIEMLNTRQYLDMRYEAYRNDNVDWRSSSVAANDLKLWDTTRYTDWQKELISGTAKYTNVNASISGGTITAQYVFGLRYNRMTTVFPGDFDSKNSGVHFRITTNSVNQRLNLQFSGSYNINHNRLPGIDLTGSATKFEPIAPRIYNDDGSLNWAQNSLGVSTWDNPLSNILYRSSEGKSNNLTSNLSIRYRVTRGLEFKADFGYNRMDAEDFRATSILGIKPESRNVSPDPRTASYGNVIMRSWLIEPQITYKNIIAKGNLEILAGATVNEEERTSKNLNGRSYSNDESLRNPGAATTVTTFMSFLEYKYAALFARLNYNWKGKYIVNINWRRDGTSRFGDKNKIHDFGSIAGGWIFTQTNYLMKHISWLSFGKIRVSYGTTGSDQISDYSYLSLYNNSNAGVPYQGGNGLYPGGLTNPYLEWEETRKISLGLELGFLNDRIISSATFSRNRSSNQLISYQLPSITGATIISQNFPATVQNFTSEFLITSTNISKRRFKWSTDFNLTIPTNKIVSFPNIDKTGYASGGSGVIIGQPLGIKKVYHYVGVDPSTGFYQFTDVNGNVTANLTTADRTVLVDPLPVYYGGVENKLSLGSLQLDFLFQFVKRLAEPALYYNGSILPGLFSTGFSNQPSTVLNRWQKPGDKAIIQRFSTANLNNRIGGSDANLTDGSFVRLKNVSLSWKAPIKSKWMTSLRLVGQCQNLLTITRYNGLDPENQTLDALPPLRVVTIGINVSL